MKTMKGKGPSTAAGQATRPSRKRAWLACLSPSILLLTLTLCLSCGKTTRTDNSLGGSEAGNPPGEGERIVTGQLETASTTTLIRSAASRSATTRNATSTCAADTVVLVDLDGEEFEISPAADCSFTTSVPIDQIYQMSFERSGTVLAVAYFQPNLNSVFVPFFLVSEGEEPIDLGLITFEGNRALAEFQPAQQNDADGDGIVDFDDTDDDANGTPDSEEDCDEDGIPDAFDEDDCEEPAEVDEDADDDGVSDAADNCPTTANAVQTDTDGDSDGDACDSDDDADGVADTADNCELTANADQNDIDQDGDGDACDDDDDDDGVADAADNCPEDTNADQTDSDADGDGDACDDDDDDDGILDDGDLSGIEGDLTCHHYMQSLTSCDDNCPTTANATQGDRDLDGTGDACEQ